MTTFTTSHGDLFMVTTHGPFRLTDAMAERMLALFYAEHDALLREPADRLQARRLHALAADLEAARQEQTRWLRAPANSNARAA